MDIGLIIIGSAYIIGIIASYIISRKFLMYHLSQYYSNSIVAKRVYLALSTIGGLIAFFPGVYLGFLFGGNFGGGVGDIIGETLGLGMIGVYMGIFVGILIVFTIVILIGVFISSSVAKAIIRLKKLSQTT